MKVLVVFLIVTADPTCFVGMENRAYPGLHAFATDICCCRTGTPDFLRVQSKPLFGTLMLKDVSNYLDMQMPCGEWRGLMFQSLVTETFCIIKMCPEQQHNFYYICILCLLTNIPCLNEPH